MKLDTTQHPKFRELKELLGLRDYVVAGMLELLWHVAARYHDDGGVGRWKDSQLARAIDYEGDPGHLVRALISAGWLDEAALPVRLAVHDWLTHCPNHVWDRVRKRAKRLVGRSAESLTAEQVWLVASFERARVERSRDGGEEESGGGGGSRDGPEPSGDKRERPPASGNVRQRPAAAPPNPRPKTQDQTQDPGSESAAAAALGAASADVPREPAAAVAKSAAAAAAAAAGATSWTDWEPLNIPTVDPDRNYVVSIEEWATLKATYPALTELGAELRGLIGHLKANPEKKPQVDRVQDAIAKWLRRSVAQPQLRARPAVIASAVASHGSRSSAGASSRLMSHEAALDADLAEKGSRRGLAASQ